MARFRGEEDAVIVEGQVTGRSGVRPVEQVRAGRIYEVDPYAAQGQGYDVTGLVDAGVSLASNPRSRTLALLVKIPLFAYVAFSHRMPPLVRLAALGLGAMEALEALQRQGEIEQTLPEWR